MKALIEIVIALVDLLEAEMRQLQQTTKQTARQLLLGFGCLIVASLLAFTGFCLLLGAVFYWIAAAGLSVGWSALITGCLAFALSIIAALCFRRLTSR